MIKCPNCGIAFKTTYHTYIKWLSNIEIKERNEEDWRE